MSKAKLFSGKRWYATEVEITKGKKKQEITINVPVNRVINKNVFQYNQLNLTEDKKSIIENTVDSWKVAESLGKFYNGKKPQDLWEPEENLIFKIREPYKNLDYLIVNIKKGEQVGEGSSYYRNTIAEKIPKPVQKFKVDKAFILVSKNKEDYDKSSQNIGDNNICINIVSVDKSKINKLHEEIKNFNSLVKKIATLRKQDSYFTVLCKDKNYPQIIKSELEDNYPKFINDFQSALDDLKQSFSAYMGTENIPALIWFFQGKKIEKGEFTVLWQLAKDYIVDSQKINAEDENLKAVIIDELYSICVMTQKLSYIHEFKSTKPNTNEIATIQSRLQHNHKHFGYTADSNKDDILQQLIKQELTGESQFTDIYQQYKVEALIKKLKEPVEKRRSNALFQVIKDHYQSVYPKEETNNHLFNYQFGTIHKFFKGRLRKYIALQDLKFDKVFNVETLQDKCTEDFKQKLLMKLLYIGKLDFHKVEAKTIDDKSTAFQQIHAFEELQQELFLSLQEVSNVFVSSEHDFLGGSYNQNSYQQNHKRYAFLAEKDGEVVHGLLYTLRNHLLHYKRFQTYLADNEKLNTEQTDNKKLNTGKKEFAEHLQKYIQDSIQISLEKKIVSSNIYRVFAEDYAEKIHQQFYDNYAQSYEIAISGFPTAAKAQSAFWRKFDVKDKEKLFLLTDKDAVQNAINFALKTVYQSWVLAQIKNPKVLLDKLNEAFKQDCKNFAEISAYCQQQDAKLNRPCYFRQKEQLILAEFLGSTDTIKEAGSKKNKVINPYQECKTLKSKISSLLTDKAFELQEEKSISNKSAEISAEIDTTPKLAFTLLCLMASRSNNNMVANRLHSTIAWLKNFHGEADKTVESLESIHKLYLNNLVLSNDNEIDSQYLLATADITRYYQYEALVDTIKKKLSRLQDNNFAKKLLEKIESNSIFLTSRADFKIAQEQTSQSKIVMKGFGGLKDLKKELSKNQGEDKTTVIDNIASNLLNKGELNKITNEDKQDVLSILQVSNAELFDLHPYRLQVNAQHYNNYVKLIEALTAENEHLRDIYYKSDDETPEFFRSLFNVASESTKDHQAVNKHMVEALNGLSKEDISFYQNYKKNNSEAVHHVNTWLNSLGKENKGKAPVYKKYQTANKLAADKDGFTDEFNEYRRYLHLVSLIEGQYWLDNCHLLEKISSELQRHIFKLEKDLHYLTVGLAKMGILHYQEDDKKSGAFPTGSKKQTTGSRYVFRTGIKHGEQQNCHSENAPQTCFGCYKSILQKLNIKTKLLHDISGDKNIRNFIAHNYLIREPNKQTDFNSIAKLVTQLDDIMSYNRAYLSNVRDGVITLLTKQYLQLDKSDYQRLGKLTIDQLFSKNDGKEVDNGVYFKTKTIQYSELKLYDDWVLNMLRDVICLEIEAS